MNILGSEKVYESSGKIIEITKNALVARSYLFYKQQLNSLPQCALGKQVKSEHLAQNKPLIKTVVAQTKR